MKYSVTVEINKDRDTVLKLIQEPEHFKDWMDGLVDYKIVNKTQNHVGTITELIFSDSKGRTTSMIEEVVDVDLPNSIVTTYEAGGVFNQCINRFDELEESTIYTMDTIFKFGFFTNLYIWIFKPMFRSQTLKGMLSFKKFVEKEDE